ncbi:MAG: hypothetical protein RI883_441 [Bacteroidota bacterium]|jgi:hypothetical protein
MIEKVRNKKHWPFLTLTGIAIYTILYIIATRYYPGGSNFDKTQIGFHWSTNYWCELLGEYSKNGFINKARPIALVGMIFLSLSLSLFWIQLPNSLSLTKISNRIIQFCGMLSMIFFSLIFTDYHDVFIGLAVLFGATAFILTIYGFYKLGNLKTYLFGSFCLILVAINNLIYLFDFQINYLPILQKITFLCIFVWITSITFYVSKKTGIT